MSWMWNLGRCSAAQKRLLGALEEVQSLDRSLAVSLRLAESNEIALPAGRVVDGGRKLQVTSVATEQNLPQVDQAVDRLFYWGSSRVAWRSRCSTLRWCLKKETSLLVVSRRRTQPNLS